MHLIAYTSTSCIPHDEVQAQIDHIVETAKHKNRKLDITGVLFFLNDCFLQIIEGDEENLRQLMQIIQNDTRHKNIDIVIDCMVEKRGFSQWNMDVFHLKSIQSFNAPTIRSLTESFIQNLLPRSDSLLYFYKALIETKPTKAPL